MTGVAITANTEKATDLLGDIIGRMNNPRPALKVIGETIRTSIVRNFESGGRPSAWAAHSPTTRKRRKGGAILRRSGQLMSSIAWRITGPGRVEIGTNKIYAAVHQFGAKKGSFGTITAQVKAHMRKGKKVRAHTRRQAIPWGDIPARPFIMIQDADYRNIRADLLEFFIGGE